MAGGKFDGNIEYWSPEPKKSGSIIFGEALVSTGAGAQRLYILGKTQIVRIIPAADMNIYFINDSGAVVDATSAHILLKAGEEHFISCGENKFMVASVNTANVIAILQKGSVARNASSS